MKEEIISYVIPTYREERYIESCLKSILNQDYRGKKEIIVIDSNSPDNTREIAKNNGAKVINIRARGISKARNLGIKNANGNIIIFTEGDVILSANFTKEILKVINKEKVVGATGIGIPYGGNVLHKSIYYLLSFFIIIFTWLKLPSFSGSFTAYKKKYLQKIGGFDEKMGIAEDMDASKRLRKFGKCKIAYHALAKTSTRKLVKNGITKTVLFYVYNDLKYLLLDKKLPPTKFKVTEEL